MWFFARTGAVACIFSVVACSPSGDSTYTLYRNSVLDSSTRIHVASFDTAEGNDYNSENCELARALFQGQDGVSVRYWCEKGRFEK